MKLMLLEDWIDSVNQKDGITKEKEIQMRCESISFLTNYGLFFKLSQNTIAKAARLFHQIAHQTSFKKLDRYLYAAVCVFIASKIDDSIRPLKDIVKGFDCFTAVQRK